MKLYVTKGFDGEKVHCFGEFQSERSLNSAILNFKNNSKERYRITPYETITSTNDGKVVDFGDYSYFLKIEN